MNFLRRLTLAFKAITQLGPGATVLFVLYQLGLKSGYFRIRTFSKKYIATNPTRSLPQEESFSPKPCYVIRTLLELPSREILLAVVGKEGKVKIIAEADEITSGQVRLFGGSLVPLELSVPGLLKHWTYYEKGRLGDRDIKFTWEPGRFGWAYFLARAYHLSGEERYSQAFWTLFESFMNANPPYIGPQWTSAQEVALRIIALVFSVQVFISSPQSTPERLEKLGWFIAASAERIPPTLVYAQSLNNNHLLTEAIGLYTAGSALPDHPAASHWRSQGWRWFNRGLQAQIAPDGAYIQQSSNYHRLMLQIALWGNALIAQTGGSFPELVSRRLQAATSWLHSMVDPVSGQVPNLGPNDGAYILPLTTCPFMDYRPVLQAASLIFSKQRAFTAGEWDEMSLWLGYKVANEEGKDARIILSRNEVSPLPLSVEHTPHILHHPSHPSWAYLRVARFSARPGHADQLHLDLWWRGLNVARDAGTYLYNAAPPWENSLSSAAVHNTVTVNGFDQMTHAGRFLWLDWAQAHVLAGPRPVNGILTHLVAQHDGYRRLGVIHLREVTAGETGLWQIQDRLVSSGRNKNSGYILRLHWLLPDWDWVISGEDGNSSVEMNLASPYGLVGLRVSVAPSELAEGSESVFLTGLRTQLVRAGELLAGKGGASPVAGWFSPTFGDKVPALSFSVTLEGTLPLSLMSEWIFPY